MMNKIIIRFVCLLTTFICCGCNQIIETFFKEPDTYPHKEPSLWPNYQTKFKDIIIHYKIPSSDEFPEKREGIYSKDGFTSSDYYVPLIPGERGGPFSIWMDKNYAIPQYKVNFWIEKGRQNRFADKYIYQYCKYYDKEDIMIAGQKWVKITSFYTDQKEVVEREVFVIGISSTHVVELCALYGEFFSTRFSTSERWIKDRREVTKNILESIRFEKK